MLGQPRAARAVVISLVALACIAGGCSTDRKITEPDPVEVTSDLLSGALLTEADVPSPYVASQNAKQVGPEVLPEHDCDDPLKELDPKESEQSVFTANGTTLANTISYFPGQGAAVVNVYSQMLSECLQAVVPDKHLRFTTRPLNFGVLSNDTDADGDSATSKHRSASATKNPRPPHPAAAPNKSIVTGPAGRRATNTRGRHRPNTNSLYGTTGIPDATHASCAPSSPFT